MIQYTLKCNHEHRFDSWFQSAEAFDKLKASGMVTCAVCGCTEVEKAMMAPRVRTARTAAPQTDEAKTQLTEPATAAENALADLRTHLEKNSDYVGQSFAQEARAMHLGDAPVRAIHGEAKPEEAKSLLEDGIPVAPLPFLPGRKTN